MLDLIHYDKLDINWLGIQPCHVPELIKARVLAGHMIHEKCNKNECLDLLELSLQRPNHGPFRGQLRLMSGKVPYKGAASFLALLGVLIGNGLKTSLWYYRWCLQGPLIRFLSPGEIVQEGYHLQSCVANLISNRMWNWPSMCFSVKCAWEALRSRGHEVTCLHNWTGECAACFGRQVIRQKLDSPHDDNLVKPHNFLQAETEPEHETHKLRPKILFHAISQTSHHQTIRVLGKLKNKNVTVLLDGGSTHNFIDQAIVTKYSLPVTQSKRLQVTVANRAKIDCVGQCQALTVVIEGTPITASYSMLPVAAC
ncbi:retrovirus-related pol polyprotein from transposon 297 [Tanacetum coccineum]